MLLRTLIIPGLLASALAAPVAAAEPVEVPTQTMNAEDAAITSQLVKGAMAVDPELPAMFLGVWDPARGAHVAAYGATGRFPALADIAAALATRGSHHRPRPCCRVQQRLRSSTVRRTCQGGGPEEPAALEAGQG